ncbi:MAG: molecular chaperone TorD family protein, partial [Actinobacteria bacterium]|nr:molecular chaperone TorD family protein [Actinomycetota bacterium]
MPLAKNEFKQDFITIVELRAKTYGMLSRLYRAEVDQCILDTMSAMRFPINTGNDNVDEGYKLIATYLGTIWENSLTELAVDYSRTFLGHGFDAYSAAYPFESVHTSEKRLLMQDARDEVLAIYRSAGLDKTADWKDGEDHIAVELEFEQILCNRIVSALKTDDLDAALNLLSTQKNFLEDHLIAWVPVMTSDIKRFAKSDFYKGLAF